MAVYVSSIEIGGFRGMRKLVIPKLNHVNIIVGDNNCGKTSFLEALLLLRNPSDFSYIMRTARIREGFAASGSRSSPYECFLSFFPSEDALLNMNLQARCLNSDVFMRISGDVGPIMLDETEMVGLIQQSIIKNEAKPMECQAFLGKLLWGIDKRSGEESISIHEYSSLSKFGILSKPKLDMVYLSPFNHLQGNNINYILSNDAYKSLCINILQMFDEGIEDLLLLRNSRTNRPVEYVRHKEIGTMPLFTFGDGIKKILSIANGIAQAVGGVLLIDEIEIAIHSKYYEKIFQFIVSACIQFDVQLFVTSHSIEAIDGFLSTQDYNNQIEEKHDTLSVITLKNEGQRTYARVLDGSHVQQNRESFGFEVRL